jgi:hypothetical protein
VGGHANRQTGHTRIADNVPPGSTRLYTDAWPSYRGRHPGHATVAHDGREWARDDHGDGPREVHGHTCEGAGAACRTYLRAFRGVHKRYLHLDMATYEALVNTTRVTPQLIPRMCVVNLSVHIGYT